MVKLVDYLEAIKRPFGDFGKLLIGILLGILPIINLFVTGYALTAAKSVFKKKYDLPEWKNWGDFFIRGLFSAVISIIYFLPAVILLLIFAASIVPAILQGIFESYTGQISAFVVGNIISRALAAIPVLVLAVLLVLIAAYILPSALLHYIKDWKFSDAFDLKSIFNKAFKGSYLLTWLFVIVYSIIFGIVIGIIFGWIPVLCSLIVSGLLSFVIGVTEFTAFADVFRENK